MARNKDELTFSIFSKGRRVPIRVAGKWLYDQCLESVNWQYNFPDNAEELAEKMKDNIPRAIQEEIAKNAFNNVSESNVESDDPDVAATIQFLRETHNRMREIEKKNGYPEGTIDIYILDATDIPEEEYCVIVNGEFPARFEYLYKDDVRKIIENIPHLSGQDFGLPLEAVFWKKTREPLNLRKKA